MAEKCTCEPAECTCEPAEIMLYPCSGGSNVGQVANQAAVRLDCDGTGRLFCLAGLGGHVPSMIESAKAARRVIAIDGCSTGCAKATLEHAGFPPTGYVVVTELGVKKRHDFDTDAAEIKLVCREVKRKLGLLDDERAV